MQQMIERLDHIAAERMPSVSDLLQRASRSEKQSASRQPASPKGQPSAASKPQSSQPGSKQAETEGEENPVARLTAPALSATEKGYLDPSQGNTAAAFKPGALGLPTTTLDALTGNQETDASSDSSPAEQRLDQALTEQDDLLAEFRAVTELLAELLGSFEASTFVKRLKAASRAQMEIAGGINSETLSAFGLPKESPNILPGPAEAGQRLSRRIETEIENIQLIQSDLDAFISRKPDRRFTSLLETMKEERVVSELETIPARVRRNFSGNSIAAAEFWADTLDRWAEELVEATTSPP